MNEKILKSVTEILDKKSDNETLTQSLIQINRVFTEFSPIRGEESRKAKAGNLLLPTGLAISPEFAALNLRDILRTTKFLRGIKEAIDSSMERFKDERIHLIYAGCGPYGTLVLPLLTLYTPEQVKVTLLDVQPASLESVKSICHGLELTDFTGGILLEDAALYTHPADDPVHIIVSETMLHALEREPQVSIFRNLAPQLTDGGVVVPEEVRVSFLAVDPEREFNPEGKGGKDEKIRQYLGEIFVLDKNCHTKEIHGGNIPYLEAATITLPDDLQPRLPLMFFTEVKLFGDTILEPYESGITHPRAVGIGDSFNPGDKISFKYRLNSLPGFFYEKQVNNPWA